MIRECRSETDLEILEGRTQPEKFGKLCVRACVFVGGGGVSVLNKTFLQCFTLKNVLKVALIEIESCFQSAMV